MMLQRALLVSIMIAAAFASGVAAQQVRGRVVDERSRQPIRSVTVTLRDSADVVVRDAETDNNGFFSLRAPAAGSWIVVVQHPGYGERRREVTVADGEALVPAFVLQAEAIPLDTLVADARPRTVSPVPEGGFQRTSHVLAGERLARIESHGGRLMTVAREFNGLRTREYQDSYGRNHTCIESLRRVAAMGGPMESGPGALGSGLRRTPCTWVVIVLDNVVIDDPETSLRGLNLTHFESVEYLPPGDAGFRYGMEAGSSGALVLWTRGRGPHVDEARNRK
jgi:hypothetical protein